MKLEYSDTCSVRNLAFENGEVHFHFTENDGSEFDVSIKSERFISEAQEEIGVVYFQICELKGLIIDVETKEYRMPSDPKMIERVLAYSAQIAIGMNSEEYKYLVRVVGKKILLIAPIRSTQEDIKFVDCLTGKELPKTGCAEL